MKRRFLIVLFVLLAAMSELYAQKLVIGSKVDGAKEFASIEWIGNVPQSGKIFIVDFFSSNNPSAMEFYENDLPRVYEFTKDKAEIIIVTTKGDDRFFELAKADGDKYHFGIDSDGSLFKLMQVKFIPYTVMVDKNYKILWQGNLGDFDKKVL